MACPSPTRVRFALVGILTVFALGFALSPGQAQFGRPPGAPPTTPGGTAGRPPGGITGLPGGFTGLPGGIAGMPGPPLRPPGGIAGMPGAGFTGMPGAGFTGMPGGITGMPGGIAGTPGGFTGRPGGLGGGFGGGRTETVWSCTACNGELGRGPVDPGQTICPHCGAHLTGAAGPGAFGSRPGMPSTPATQPFTGTPSVPPATPPFGGGPPPETPADGSETSTPTFPAAVPFLGTPPTGDDSAATSPASSGKSGGVSRALKYVGITVAVVFLLGVIGMLVVVVKNTSNPRPNRVRHRRRPVIDFDDE